MLRHVTALLATVLTASCLTGTVDARIPAHKQSWQYRYWVWMPHTWQSLAYCESGTRPPEDPDWKHHSYYQGAFGFAPGSWDGFKPKGYPAEAYQATPWQQYQVALRIHARYGYTGWGCWNGKQHGWVRAGTLYKGGRK